MKEYKTKYGRMRGLSNKQIDRKVNALVTKRNLAISKINKTFRKAEMKIRSRGLIHKFLTRKHK